MTPHYLAHAGEELLFVLAPIAVILGIRYAADRRRENRERREAEQGNETEAET